MTEQGLFGSYGLPSSKVKNLADYTIYFGHQSVGYDIIKGIRELARSAPDLNNLAIRDISDSNKMDGPGFYHSKIGINRDPTGKMETFIERIASFYELRQPPDVAFFKLCYVDIESGTDVPFLLARYLETISDLKMRFPETTFLHVTTPLTVKPGGRKAAIVYALKGDKDNLNRSLYNNRITGKLDGSDPLFDLARVESTYPDGRRLSHTRLRRTYHSLIGDYTHDGGHLNRQGRHLAAVELIRTLCLIK